MITRLCWITIIEHQPTNYFRKRRRNNRQQPLPDPTQRILHTHYILTQTTTPSQPRTPPEPTRNNTPYPSPHTLIPPNADLWQSPRRSSYPHLPLLPNTHPLTTNSQFSNNSFSHLEISETPTYIDDLNFQPYPYQTSVPINIQLPTTREDLLNHLNMTLTDVPQNGDENRAFQAQLFDSQTVVG